MKKILLLSMPFGALERQALGLSIFKARLAEEGFQCDIQYLTFTFARLIGVENYYWLTTEIPHTAFAGEWIFTSSLYGSNPNIQSEYVREVLKGIWYLDDKSINRLLNIQNMAEHFLTHCFDTINWKDYSLVGFTSTFEQNIASLAFAKRIKASYPGIKIAFGGANWEGEMGLELHRRFTFVDYAFLGEADESFPSLIRLLSSGLLNKNKYSSIQGLVYRCNGESVLTSPSCPVAELDKLPIPDYTDYFSQLDKSSTGSFVVPTLLFESARGCWWGDKHHCLFCGLNGNSLTFRTKSASRVISEINHLADLWKMDMFQAVDNVVNMGYFKDLFPTLAKNNSSYSFFYEIRANLNRREVKMLKDAGVKHVQPGIENLNDHILNLMSKGTTGLQNIQVLKWCKENEIRADWNMLYGFPGELDEDYRQLIETIPKIRFLQAPTACGPIRLDRFSPYFNDHLDYGLINVRPIPPYKFLYPFDQESLAKIANYFDYDYAPGTCVSKLSADLINKVEEWQQNPENGVLESIEQPDGKMFIIDTRSNSIRSKAVLAGIDKEIYNYCDQVRSFEAIYNYLSKNFTKTKFTKEQLTAFLSALTNHGYMIADGESYLSLALRKQHIVCDNEKKKTLMPSELMK